MEKMAAEKPDSRVSQLFRILIHKGQAVEEAERRAAEAENGSLENAGRQPETGAGGCGFSRPEDGSAVEQPLTPTAEMEALAVQLKDRIRLFLKQGMKAEALSTIQQLQVYFPADEELARWKQELS